MGAGSCDSTSTKLLRNFKYNDELSYEDNLTIYRSLLNNYDKKKFDVNRQYNYWLTFTICIIYGSIAVIVLLSCYFFTWANELFLNTLYYFTITFIIGTILIIIILTYQVYNFDFPIIEKIPGYEINYCPDYWNYKHIKYADNPRIRDINVVNSDEKLQLGINCNFKNNSKDILQTTRIYDSYEDGNNNPYSKTTKSDSLYVTLDKTENKTDLTASEYEKFRKYVSVMNGLKYNDNNTIDVASVANQPNYDSTLTNENTINMDCNSVYPRYLAKKDIEYASDNNNLEDNKFRCAYSKLCKMPWTEAGCYSGNSK